MSESPGGRSQEYSLAIGRSKRLGMARRQTGDAIRQTTAGRPKDGGNGISHRCVSLKRAQGDTFLHHVLVVPRLTLVHSASIGELLDPAMLWKDGLV